jgi:hypothetical protein
MLAYLRLLACMAAVFAAGTASAQNERGCRRGPADGEGVEVNVAVAAHPTRVAAVLDSLLAAQGYTLVHSPRGAGEWRVEPRFTWVQKGFDPEWTRKEHPGVQLSLETEEDGDSTRVSASARALCRVPAGETEMMVELMTGTLLATGLMQHMDSLRATGVDPLTPVARGRSVAYPAEVAGFRLEGRHDYPDPRYGVNLRYTRGGGAYVDVYVYPGVRVDAACDAACAVGEEADGFVEGLPELVRAGSYERMQVTADQPLHPGAGAPWAFGRHVTLRVQRQGRTMDSHFYLYSFPGFMLKVRATYAPSDAMDRDVEAFVAELLTRLLSED